MSACQSKELKSDFVFFCKKKNETKPIVTIMATIDPSTTPADIENVSNMSVENSMFVNQMLKFLKMVTFINKGTINETALSLTIKTYNRLKKVEVDLESEASHDFIRKCVKRVNMVLKVDLQGKPLDLKNQDHQKDLITFKGNPHIISGNKQKYLDYLKQNYPDVQLLPSIPMSFILISAKDKFDLIIWQYLRSLFHLSEMILLPEDLEQAKTNLMGLKKVITVIKDFEKDVRVDAILDADYFLNTSLAKNTMEKVKMDDAKEKVKEMLEKKGVAANPSLDRMIDSITDKLSQKEMKGNVMGNMFNIARDVANSMRSELDTNSANISDTIGGICGAFNQALKDDEEGTSSIPPELRHLFSKVVDHTQNPSGGQNPMENQETMDTIRQFIEQTGMSDEQFLKYTKSENGDSIDPQKLQQLIQDMNIKDNGENPEPQDESSAPGM
jgi:hypothetical protein